MKAFIYALASLALLTAMGAKAQDVKVIDFDAQSFAGSDGIELGDAKTEDIRKLARKEITAHQAGYSEILDSKEVLQIKASADPFGESLFIQFDNERRARLTSELFSQGQIDVLVDQVRVGAFPEESKVFIHDKASGKVVKLSPFLDELSRQKELQEGDYEGITGFFRSVMDRIQGVGTYAKTEEEQEQVDDSGREIAKEGPVVEDRDAMIDGGRAQAD